MDKKELVTCKVISYAGKTYEIEISPDSTLDELKNKVVE